MLVRILGSAAGGGFPQWNCGCPGCQAVRQGRAGTQPLTQSSIAVKSKDGPWFLVNASPDVRQQLGQLWDGQFDSVRFNPIAGVILTDAEIDHTTGLIILRESSQPLRVYSTETVRKALTDGFGLLRTLEGYCGVEWSMLEPGAIASLEKGSHLEVEVFSLPGKPPKYMSQQVEVGGCWNVGLTFRHSSGGIVTYAPALASLEDKVLERFESSDCILVDGTFWRDDELPSLGITTRTARAMGHLPLSGTDGSLQRLAQLSRPRKILVHINNSNPILIAGSPERQMVEAAGIEVGYDGLTVEL